MTEQTTPQESLPSSERFSTHNEMVALHTRMILGGEALNPAKKDLPEVKEEQLTLEGFNHTVKIAAKGSVVDRLLWWEKEWQEQLTKDSSLAQLSEEQKRDKQYQIWKDKMIASFSNEKNKDRLNKLAQRKIGGIDFSGFNQQTCDQIYQRYFENHGQDETVEVVVLKENGQEKYYLPSGLSQFIDDVIAAYQGNYDEIVSDLETLKWYAGIFGTARKEEIEGKQPKGVHTDDILKELIHARIKLENEPKKQELATQANESKTINGQETTRQNFLNPKEQQHLQWLWEAGQLETKVVQRQSIVQVEPNQPPPPTEPQQEQPESPWDKIPKPDQPVKIREGKINYDSQGKRIGEQAEVHLVYGTKEHPLVVDRIWSNGSKERIRTTNSERPYHIPAVIYFDEDISPQQKQVILETVRQVALEVGIPEDLILESPRSANEFFSKTPPPKERPNQYLGSLFLSAVEMDRSQIEQPHHFFVFTNKDLTDLTNGGYFNFLVGVARPDLGTVISLKRIWEGIKDPDLKNETIRTEIAHEIGHVYGLPSLRRGEKNLDYETVRGGGGHCKSPGCCMKQGNAVPADFIRITQERLRFLGKDRFYCAECHRDLENKFNPKTVKDDKKGVESFVKPQSL